MGKTPYVYIKKYFYFHNPRSCTYLKKFPLKKYILSSHWFTSYSSGQILKNTSLWVHSPMWLRHLLYCSNAAEKSKKELFSASVWDPAPLVGSLTPFISAFWVLPVCALQGLPTKFNCLTKAWLPLATKF